MKEIMLVPLFARMISLAYRQTNGGIHVKLLQKQQHEPQTKMNYVAIV